MYYYFIYNLNIASEIELSGMPKADFSAPDVKIKFGKTSTKSNGYNLKINDVAEYQITNGNEIIIEPSEQIEQLYNKYQTNTDLEAFKKNIIKTFLMGSAMGALLHQRQYLVLHGNAIKTKAGCLIFVAHSGTGKSTTAAAFLKQGYQILTDDVCPIDCSDEEPKVIPGYPQIKLWKETLDHLQLSSENLEPVFPENKKFRFPVNEQYCSVPQSIAAIIELNAGDCFSMKPIQGVEKFKTLKEHTYREYYLKPLGLMPEHLNACSLIANQTPTYTLTRPSNSFNAEQLVEFVLKNLDEKTI